MDGITTFSGIAGLILSLAFAYIPGLKDAYGKLTGVQKSGIMAVLLIVVAVAVYALSCNGIIEGYSCDSNMIAKALLAALVANQSTYTMIPSIHKN